MVEIKYRNIPLFIGKMLLMIFPVLFTCFIFMGDLKFNIILLLKTTMLFIYQLGYILIIPFFIYFIFNLYAFVVLYTKKIIFILSIIDIILFILFLVLLICLLTLYEDKVELGTHGFIVIIPLVSGIIYFFLAFIIDILIIRKMNN